MGILNKLTNTFRPLRVHTDAADELAFHLEQRTRENIRNGMPQEQARHSAKRSKWRYPSLLPIPRYNRKRRQEVGLCLAGDIGLCSA